MTAGGAAARLLHDGYPAASVWLGVAMAVGLHLLVRTSLTRTASLARGTLVVAATLLTMIYFVVIAGETFRPARAPDGLARFLQGLVLIARVLGAAAIPIAVAAVAGWRSLGSPRPARAGALAPLLVGLTLSLVFFVVSMAVLMAAMALPPRDVRPFVLVAVLFAAPPALHSLWVVLYTAVLASWRVPREPIGLLRGLADLEARTAFRFDRVLCLGAAYGSGRECQVTSSVAGSTLIVSEPVASLLEADELLAVLAHEAAHVERHHVRRKYAFAAIATGVVLVLSGVLATLGLWVVPSRLTFLVFVVPAMIFSFLRGLYNTRITRNHEREADEYAARATSGDALLRALEKLRKGRVAPNVDHRWTTHGTWEQRSARIAALGQERRGD